MKKLLAALAACLVTSIALLSGCASTGSAPQMIVQPQQLIAGFCPVVNADLKVLGASTLLNADQQALVAKVLTVNTAVCAAGSSVDFADLQTLNATLFPALITLVASVPTLPNQPTILLGLELAQPILSQVVATIQAQQAVPAGAASTPLAGVPIK